MNPETQGGLLIFTGGVVGRMAMTGTYLLYVREGMRPLLLGSALILVLLGAMRVWSALYPSTAALAMDASAGPHEAHDHGLDGDHHGSRVAWLLVVPMLAVVLIAPNPLGSFTAARQAATTPAAADLNDAFPPLPATGEPVALPVLDFVTRALFDEQRSLDGVTVKLVGMVSPAAKGGDEDFRLTRFMIACCAADGQAIQVAVHGTTGPLPPTDSWVEVIGHWRAPPTGTTPEDQEAPPLDLTKMRPVPQPENPYE